MNKIIYQLHIWLGVVISVPLFAWASSGLIYSLPNTVEGNKVDVIDGTRVKISVNEAIVKAHEFAGKKLPTTALTLLMRDGQPFYQAVGGMGADSLLINAETGEVLKPSLPNLATRYFREAHFYFFAGRWQSFLLILISALTCLSSLSGIYLNLVLWFGKR